MKEPVSHHPESIDHLANGLSIQEFTFRAKRGYIAKELIRRLPFDYQDSTDELFFLSFQKESFLFTEDKTTYQVILSISEKLLFWVESGMDTSIEIINLNIDPTWKEPIIDLCTQIKTELPTKNAMNESTIEGKWMIYRDVIFAASQKKLLLITEKEKNYYTKGSVILESFLTRATDVPFCRKLFKEFLLQEKVTEDICNRWILALSEAITNTIKHAKDGKMTLIIDQSELRCIVEDKGSGIGMEELPNFTLLNGYSTKNSLGQGFNLMMTFSDQLLLHTSEKGTTLILTFKLNNDTSLNSIKQLR